MFKVWMDVHSKSYTAAEK